MCVLCHPTAGRGRAVAVAARVSCIIGYIDGGPEVVFAVAGARHASPAGLEACLVTCIAKRAEHRHIYAVFCGGVAHAHVGFGRFAAQPAWLAKKAVVEGDEHEVRGYVVCELSAVTVFFSDGNVSDTGHSTAADEYGDWGFGRTCAVVGVHGTCHCAAAGPYPRAAPVAAAKYTDDVGEAGNGARGNDRVFFGLGLRGDVFKGETVHIEVGLCGGCAVEVEVAGYGF